MFLFGFVIAVIVAAFTARDANKRGMSGMGWFFGVAFLLIVFLPLYLIVRKPLLPQYQPQLAQPPQGMLLPATGVPNLCMHCGKYYAGQAKYCPLCGKPQDIAANSASV
jgi:hypothetical protein